MNIATALDFTYRALEDSAASAAGRKVARQLRLDETVARSARPHCGAVPVRHDVVGYPDGHELECPRCGRKAASLSLTGAIGDWNADGVTSVGAKVVGASE